MELLASLAVDSINQEMKDWLAEITTFNVEARYDIFKEKLHKKATKTFTKKYFDITVNLYDFFKKKL